MSISPMKSNEPSRPASPAADALEVLSSNEEAITPEEAIKMQANQSRRKSSSWKGFKRQLTKAEMKIKSTFSEASSSKDRKGSIFFYGPTEGTPLSPVEISPDSVESSPSSPEPGDVDEFEKAEKIAQLIKNIEELGADLDSPNDKDENKGSNQESETSSIVKSDDSGEKKEKMRSISTPHGPVPMKRVEFIEESFKKVNVTPIEGAFMSRPTELSLEDENAPLRPPRTKKDSQRTDRLLSVPNIKLNKQQLSNLRKPSTSAAKADKNKGNFMRRFSKY